MCFYFEGYDRKHCSELWHGDIYLATTSNKVEHYRLTFWTTYHGHGVPPRATNVVQFSQKMRTFQAVSIVCIPYLHFAEVSMSCPTGISKILALPLPFLAL